MRIVFKVATLNIICARFVMGYPCVRHFVLYSWSRYFALFLSYANITKCPFSGHFEIFPPKGYSPRLSDIAEHLNYQI